MRLLVVCLGNICRSPTAEGLIRHRLEAASLADRVTVDSAGTGDWHVGQPPDRRSIACATGHGIDLSGLRARQIGPSDFHEFDWLLCASAQSALLLEWAGLDQREVPDPYTGDAHQFERVWALLERAADGVVARLASELDDGR